MPVSVDRPSKPYNLSITDCGLACIQLSWYQNKSPGLSRFEITYTGEDGLGATEAIDSRKTTFNFTELVPGRAYYFSVVAVSVAGEVVGRSPQSNHIKFEGLKFHECNMCTCSNDHGFFLAYKGFDTCMKSMPSSGTLLADNLGTMNFAIINCSILSYSKSVSVLWSLRNISTDHRVDNNTAPELFYIEEEVTNITRRNFFTQSHFIILNLTSDLDGVVVFCGTHEEPKVANFSLRVYCK